MRVSPSGNISLLGPKWFLYIEADSLMSLCLFIVCARGCVFSVELFCPGQRVQAAFFFLTQRANRKAI